MNYKQICPTDFERDDEDDDVISVNSVETNMDLVLLWDVLKSKFRKSEEDEVRRLIGAELVQKGEDLREEYNNFSGIYQEIQETQSVARAKQEIQDNLKKTSGIFSSGGNAKFLTQELSFFIENLQQKAIDSGLEENSLIPNQNGRDKEIFDYINTNVMDSPGLRPQSAMTGISNSSKMSMLKMKDHDPAGIDASMRTSFYSTQNGFNTQKTCVVGNLQVKNILELSPEQMEKIVKIRQFIQEQLDGLTQEINEMKQLIFSSSSPNQQVEESIEPSQKELKEYSTKLQDELLNSDQNIRVQKAIQPIIKKPTFNGPVKVLIQKSSIDRSPQKIEDKSDSKIVKVKLQVKRGNSQTKLKAIRTSSQSRIGGKIKIKKTPVREEEKKQEMYGLDMDLLANLGLGDYLDENKQDSGEEDPSYNMTYEEMRKQYNMDGQTSAVNKLRGACNQYKDTN